MPKNKKIDTTDLIDRDDNDEVRPALDLDKSLSAQANARTFGQPDLPDATRQIAKPLFLDRIMPDPAQPRREVPFTVRKRAREDNAPEWETWHAMAERLGGKEIPLNTLLRGEGEAPEFAHGEEVETEGAALKIKRTGKTIVDDFMELVSLAASINRDGLANAITVIQRGTGYIIDTGERRYQAYKLLYGALRDDNFAKIPARAVDKSDVWRQAAENGSRKPLNAIGMARQLALLIMELNKGRDGINYLSFDQFEGECDRAFYAQVVNGNVHRIPKGSSERILQATGLKSYSQLAQYRALLDIPDEIWMEADEEGWTEFKIRERVKPPSQASHTFTGRKGMTSNQSAPSTPLNATGGPLRWPLEGDGVRYMWHQGQRVQLEEATKNGYGVLVVRVWKLIGDTRQHAYTAPMSELKETPPAMGPFQKPGGIHYDTLHHPYPATAAQDVLNQIFQHKNGLLYRITGTLPDGKVQGFTVDNQGNRKGRISETLNRGELFAKPAAPAFDPDAAMVAIMGDDDESFAWQVGMRVIYSYQPVQYEGVIVTVHASGDEVTIERPDGEKRRVATKWLRLAEDGETIDVEQVSADEEEATTPDETIRVGDKVKSMSSPLIWTVIAVDKDFLSLEAHDGAHKHARPMELTRYVTKLPSDADYPPLPAWAVIGQRVQFTPPPHRTDQPTQDEIRQLFINAGGKWSATIKARNGVNIAAGLDEITPLYDETEDILPDWAVTGATVVHRDTGKICDVVGTGRDDQVNLWLLHVDIRGEGRAAAPVREFDPIWSAPDTPIPEAAVPVSQAPYAPHPALKNLSGVITEAQRKIAPLATLAGMLGHKEDEDILRSVPVLAPKHLLDRLNTDGYEATRQRILDQRAAGERTLTETWEIFIAQNDEALVVLQALADDQARKRGA